MAAPRRSAGRLLPCRPCGFGATGPRATGWPFFRREGCVPHRRSLHGLRSSRLAADTPPAAETAFAVQQQRPDGARMVGTTLTDELAYSHSGENMHYGTPVNPCCPHRIPSGSSHGSVVAVAGGLVDCARGTDGGGSVRLLASDCGVLGMRPTYGRVSLEGAIPFGPSCDTVGWFARPPTVLRKVGHGWCYIGNADDPHPTERGNCAAR
jgi:hypothetical protein